MPSEAVLAAIIVAALGATAGAITAIINRRATVEAARLAAEPNLINSLTSRIDKLTERLDERDRDFDAVRDELEDVQDELRRVIVDRNALVMYVQQLRTAIGPDAPPWPQVLAHLVHPEYPGH